MDFIIKKLGVGKLVNPLHLECRDRRFESYRLDKKLGVRSVTVARNPVTVLEGFESHVFRKIASKRIGKQLPCHASITERCMRVRDPLMLLKKISIYLYSICVGSNPDSDKLNIEKNIVVEKSGLSRSVWNREATKVHTWVRIPPTIH